MNSTLKKAIDSAIKTYQQGREKLHAVACKCVAHTLEHGEVTPSHYLLEQMGERSQTRHRLAAWIRHHGRYEDSDGKSKQFITANIASDGKIKVKVASQDIRSQYSVEQFKNGPYQQVLDIQKTKTPFELEKALIQLVKKAEKNGETPESITEGLQKALKTVNG